jgi:hypothetical protein
MHDPMAAINAGTMPRQKIEFDPAGYEPHLVDKGTRIELWDVLIGTFTGVKTVEPERIAKRLMHYLRSMCATGTVKNRHAAKAHISSSMANVGVIPRLTIEVTNAGGTHLLGPEPGVYPVPDPDITPTGGDTNDEGIQENSKLFCDVMDFSGSKTITVAGAEVATVYYDGTAIIAGESVRAEMLADELRQGLTHKSQMGLHLCKDFIPLKNDNPLSRQLLFGEYYYDFKVFLNCQRFQLNADRNVVTNQDSDEVAWIFQDFEARVRPDLEARYAPYKKMKDEEDAATSAIRKTRSSTALKAGYAGLDSLPSSTGTSSVLFAKIPKKEADVSHLLAMMVQTGAFAADLAPIAGLGLYIDDSTDLLVEDASGAPLLVEVEMSLPNLFRHGHPLNSYDVVVVWNLGGMGNGSSKQAPWGTNAQNLTVTLLSGPAAHSWHLKWGTMKKSVIVLSELL